MNIAAIRRKHFPVKTGAGYTIRVATKKEVDAFVGGVFDSVFPPQEGSLRFIASPERRAQLRVLKERYEVLHHEWFLFTDSKGTPIGWHIGEAEDAVTFYMRNTGVLPAHQNRGIYEAFFAAFKRYLGELGYERVTSQHKATNRRILILKLRQGFEIAGVELTENWGAVVKVVLLLAPDRRLSFYRQFGQMDHLGATPPNKALQRTRARRSSNSARR